MYLLWARPAVSVLALAVFGGLALAGETVSATDLGLLGVTLVAALGYAFLARRAPLRPVLRLALIVDTALIAAMSAVLARADLLAIGYFWPIAFAAFLLGFRDTILFVLLGIGATLAVAAASVEVDALTLAIDVVTVLAIGSVLALLARNQRLVETELAAERAHDAAALRIAQRIRSSLDMETVLSQTVEELGQACHAARALIRPVLPEGPLFQWTRPGVEPVPMTGPSVAVQRVVGARVPVVLDEIRRGDAELQGYMRSLGIEALVGFPVAWQGEVVAVIGLHDDRPRAWETAALPLLARIAPVVGAALAQAQLFARQLETVDRLEEIARMREQLVANVSHELRTPLTSTIGFLRTLERDDLPVDESERRRFLALARGEAERLGRLVEDLLELARLGRGVLPLQLKPVRVADLARHVAAGMTADGRTVRVQVDERATADADPDRLVQVLSNLMENALLHGEGVVTVRGGPQGDRIVIEVGDEGEGIPGDRLQQLFQPFARWNEEAAGTGLGLAISRALVEAHGGSLTYRPAENSQAHAFVVSLPQKTIAAGS